MKPFLLAIVIVATSLLARAEEPRFVLSLKDGSDLTQFLNKNPWGGDLQKTNLYEGLALRLTPLMSALPNDKQTTWKGRIADTFIELALKNRPVHIGYYHEARLVQPLGFSIQGLGTMEVKALQVLVESLRSTEDQKIEGAGKKPLSVTPILLANQKLAIKLAGSCMAISRDPKVAIWSWQHCQSETPLAVDARVRVNIVSIAGGTEKALQNFIGVRHSATVQFNKADDNTYSLKGAILPLSKTHNLKNSKISDSQLSALPSTANVVVRTALPMPQNLSVESLKEFIATPELWKKSKSVVATYFQLGSIKLKEGGVVSETGILIDKSTKDLNETTWAQVFEPRFGRDVFVKDVCGKKITLVTPAQSVIAKIENACGGKVPSLKQIPAELRDFLSTDSGVQTVLFNVGQTFSQMVDLGWDIDNVDKPQPDEIKEAKKILSRLPAFVLRGKIENESIAYQGKQGVY